MGKADKVIQAHSLAKRIDFARNLVFGSDIQNGFFLTFSDRRVMEFDTKIELEDFRDSLNLAILPIVTSITSTIDTKVDSIVNA